jgi:hypothetical protein
MKYSTNSNISFAAVITAIHHITQFATASDNQQIYLQGDTQG